MKNLWRLWAKAIGEKEGTTDAEAVPIATIPLAVLPRPTGTDDIRRSECFLNPAGCASESTGSPHDDIPT